MTLQRYPWLYTSLVLSWLSLSPGDCIPRLTLSTDSGIASENWEGAIAVVALSPRTVSLSLAPEEIAAMTVELAVEGLDPGDYFLCVSGQEPRIVSTDNLSKGVEALLPAVVGPAVEKLREYADVWKKRVEDSLELAEEYGHPRDDIPGDILQTIDRILALCEEVGRTEKSNAAIVRVTPKDAGPVPLPALASIPFDQIGEREEELKTLATTYIRQVASVDEEVRDPALEILVPVTLGEPSGTAVALALDGKAGRGELDFQVTSPPANPRIAVTLETMPSGGWMPLGEGKTTSNLDPGQSGPVSFSFDVVATTPDRRISVPFRIAIQSEGFSLRRKTHLAFGQGLIRRWSLIGPFPDPEHQGVDSVFPPEEKVDLEAIYPGVEGQVGWNEVEANEDGYLNLATLLSPSQDCVAYAVVWVFAPKGQEVALTAGSNDGMKVWLNDRVIHQFREGRVARPDQDRFKARLKQGWNQLLVKVTQTGGGWGLYFSIRDRDDGTPDGLRVSTRPPGE